MWAPNLTIVLEQPERVASKVRLERLRLELLPRNRKNCLFEIPESNGDVWMEWLVAIRCVEQVQVHFTKSVELTLALMKLFVLLHGNENHSR